MDLSTKSLPIQSADLKFDPGRRGFFSGYASKFGGVDSYGDTILPGAYKMTLENRDRPILMRWNHYGPVIGKWIVVREDEVGLYVEGELTPGHSRAEDTYASMKHGAVTGLSIGFFLQDYEEMKSGGRLIKAVDLVEVSVVESPADLGAQITGVKSLIEAAKSLREIEALLRDSGAFSRSDAALLVSRIKHLAHGERDAEMRVVRAGEVISLLKATHPSIF